MGIILASKSPRRQLLLKEIFEDFKVVTSDASEVFLLETPEANVMNVSRNKAEAIERNYDDLVIGSDTTVYMNGKYYGKPENQADAKRMLRELSGNEHIVYTGVCVIYKDTINCFCDIAYVNIYKLSDEFIDRYILSGSPMDKAGAYGIQDGGIVESYRGDKSTIMGLPLKMLKVKLRDIMEDLHGY